MPLKDKDVEYLVNASIEKRVVPARFSDGEATVRILKENSLLWAVYPIANSIVEKFIASGNGVSLEGEVDKVLRFDSPLRFGGLTQVHYGGNRYNRLDAVLKSKPAQ